MSVSEKSVDLHVPIRTAYNQCPESESPRLMEGARQRHADEPHHGVPSPLMVRSMWSRRFC